MMKVDRVAKAIDQAIADLTVERDGLAQRLTDVTSRAAIVAGNGADDYLTREKAVSDRLSELDTEVKNAQSRLDHLTYNISQFEYLRDELRSRLSDAGGSAARDDGPNMREPAVAS
ncbi:hypothetical protein [Bradyrhizobium sp. LHD-71]|uniref:hypothetical protein n=1 Tax=Bradyrhizobium sp. LHD-71 TaxID=3072141 RepID=UPI00280DD007|nr:hypothetical protein [Bradyrhizobium sp. LHD-71]MDQ8729782.1 hypothetical protein [Bradyrhizobium sp. LHD-71]